MKQKGGDMIPAKEGKNRKASRPVDVVFSDHMERAYQTALNLIGKAKKLSRHKAAREAKNAAMLNRFLGRVSQELATCQVTPGQIGAEEKVPTLGEFLAPAKT